MRWVELFRMGKNIFILITDVTQMFKNQKNQPNYVWI
jgi:hypothetical protein